MRQRAVCIIIDPDRKAVMLIRRFKDGRAYATLPGGKLEPGETPEAACMREALEETGLTVKLGKKVRQLVNLGKLEHYFAAESFSGMVQLGGPEAESNSPENSYIPEWVPVEHMAQVNLLPAEAHRMVKSVYLELCDLSGAPMSQPSLPHWDMTPLYPALDAPEFDRDFAALAAEIEALGKQFDAAGINKCTAAPFSVQAQTVLEAALSAVNALSERLITIRSYISSFVTTDSRNTLAQAKLSEFQQVSVRLTKLMTRLNAWIGAQDVDAMLSHSAEARRMTFTLRKAQVQAKHMMTQGEEELAADLNLSAGSAWGRLYNNFTSQISVPFDGDALPISALRNLAYSPEPSVRQRAYQAELQGWKQHALPLAAALNSIKGEVITLSGRRGWAEPLDVALFINTIDRATLNAMLEAARAHFVDFRRYLKAKARLLGLQALPFYDLFAPVGAARSQWRYNEAHTLIVEQFHTFSAKMGNLAERAFNEHWIDAEPRLGKQDGAFCMAVRPGESRILSNYQPGFKSVLTLAHELGHAYHNLNLAGQPPLNRIYPMTLAETASIFCETIVRKALLAKADAPEQLMILDGTLTGATQQVVDIYSRFLFESRVFERRARRELSVDELCGIMQEAQQETYGDGLDSQALHPYMWAAKLHYYSTANSFYNFPYMFGLLFGLGLYARFQADPERFKEGYDALLASAGEGEAAELALRMQVDIRSPEFWHASLEIIRQDVERFEQAAG